MRRARLLRQPQITPRQKSAACSRTLGRAAATTFPGFNVVVELQTASLVSYSRTGKIRGPGYALDCTSRCSRETASGFILQRLGQRLSRGWRLLPTHRYRPSVQAPVYWPRGVRGHRDMQVIFVVSKPPNNAVDTRRESSVGACSHDCDNLTACEATSMPCGLSACFQARIDTTYQTSINQN
jgi:hypothetical protein